MKPISNAAYTKIRRMSREELSRYLRILYREGVQDGESLSTELDLSEVLLNTKGVGDILHQRIMLNYKESRRRLNEQPGNYDEDIIKPYQDAITEDIQRMSTEEIENGLNRRNENE